MSAVGSADGGAAPGAPRDVGDDVERAAPDAGGAGPLPPGWRRLHPVSPALRSWKLLVVLLLFYAQNRGRDLFADDGRAPGLSEILATLAVLALVLVVATAGGVASWWFSRWALDGESVRLHSGVLARQQRSARLDRVQAVDLVRPPVARVFGFAEVRVEVAGGAGSAIRLAYLRRADAEEVQSALLARAQQRAAPRAPREVAPGRAADGEPVTGGAPPAPGAVPDAAPGSAAEGPRGQDPREGFPAGSSPLDAGPARPVLTVAFPRLLGSVALTTLPPFVLVAALSAVALAVSGSFASLYGAGPLLLGLGAATWRDLSRGGAWTVESTATGLRLRHGLLERRTQSIPRGRVQAVRVRQPALWRLTGWWRVEVNVAGYGSEGGDAGSSTRVVPVCSRSQVDELLALVLPVRVGAGEVDDGLGGTSAGGTAAGGAWTCSPRRARWLDPFAWRRQGALAADEVLLLRRGRLVRTLDVVPHGRTQSLALARGPVQSRLGLVTLVVHSTPGPVSPAAPHLDAGAAAALLLAQAGRAEAAMAREDA